MPISLVHMSVTVKKHNVVIAREENCHNLLHSVGTHYILASAFAPDASPIKGVPSSWYFGLDRRKELNEGQVLADANTLEPDAEDYQRLKIEANNGFAWFWQEAKDTPPRFTISGQTEFNPEGDWGIVRNFFLTNAAEGDNGILISSVPLRHAYPVDEGTAIQVEYYLDLREAKGIKEVKETKDKK
jgi:hypothetical protein